MSVYGADEGPKLFVNYSGWTWITNLNTHDDQITAYVRFDILSLEIIGVLVLAGAGFLITKKKGSGGKG